MHQTTTLSRPMAWEGQQDLYQRAPARAVKKSSKAGPITDRLPTIISAMRAMRTPYSTAAAPVSSCRKHVRRLTGGDRPSIGTVRIMDPQAELHHENSMLSHDSIVVP